MKNENKKDLVKVDIVDVLLSNNNNTENIVMFNDKGEQIEFMQICVIPDRKNLYCILKPINEIENIASNEAIVFRVVNHEDKREAYLEVETDEKQATKIFSKYEKLVTKEQSSVLKRKIKKLISEDENLFKVFSRGKEKIDFCEYIIIPTIYQGTIYAIIQDTLKDEGALLWKIVSYEDGKEYLEWEENDFLAFYLVERYRNSGGKKND